jgi:hypothetical protein
MGQGKNSRKEGKIDFFLSSHARLGNGDPKMKILKPGWG